MLRCVAGGLEAFEFVAQRTPGIRHGVKLSALPPRLPAPRSPQGEVWRVVWLPAVPLLWTAVTASTIAGLKSARRELAALRAARYSFRRV